MRDPLYSDLTRPQITRKQSYRLAQRRDDSLALGKWPQQSPTVGKCDVCFNAGNLGGSIGRRLTPVDSLLFCRGGSFLAACQVSCDPTRDNPYVQLDVSTELD